MEMNVINKFSLIGKHMRKGALENYGCQRMLVVGECTFLTHVDMPSHIQMMTTHTLK